MCVCTRLHATDVYSVFLRGQARVWEARGGAKEACDH